MEAGRLALALAARRDRWVVDNTGYAKGIGDVRELTIKGPQQRLVLVQVSR